MDRYIALPRYSISHTDFVRFWVIVSFSLCCIFISSLALSRHIETIYSQLFYFPIVYASYFYTRRGVYVAGACALGYQTVAYYYFFPNTISLGYTTGQAVLFICIAAAVSYFTEKVRNSEAQYRSIFENSQLGIVLFDQNTFSITLANDQFRKLLGYSNNDLKRMKLSDLFFNKEEERRFFKGFRLKEKATNYEVRFVTKSGDPWWVNLSCSVVNDQITSCSIVDINRQKLHVQTGADQSSRNRQLVETWPTSLIITINHLIIFTNPAFTAFSGYQKDELTGKTLDTVVHPDDRENFLVFVQKAESKKSLSDKSEIRFISKSKETKRAALFSIKIMHEGNPGLLFIIEDLSEPARLKEKLQKDNERRRGIIGTVAHELRTPLQPIMGYLNLLMQDPENYGLNEETRQILNRCLQSVDRERQIINQMIDFSVLDSGKIQLDYSVFSVPNLLKNIINASGYSMKADITINVPPDLKFEADAHKISIVIDSMLSNAVIYSKPPRKVKIIYSSNGGEQFHKLAIQDNGIGITESQLDEIFEPFQLADSDKLSRKYERIGLSLSIAKKYIQMHGGYISVDSTVNIGSTFTIHLPKARIREEVNYAS